MEGNKALYRPLTEGKKDIRLLQLSPGSGPDDIQCTLCQVSLLNNPDYEVSSRASLFVVTRVLQDQYYSLDTGFIICMGIARP